MTPSLAHELQEYFDGTPPHVSFEFFPPKTPEMEAKLWEAITQLAPLTPSFVSVTYGAGGTTRERTHNTLKRILTETSLKPAAHLTCVAATKAEVQEYAERWAPWNTVATWYLWRSLDPLPVEY